MDRSLQRFNGRNGQLSVDNGFITLPRVRLQRGNEKRAFDRD